MVVRRQALSELLSLLLAMSVCLIASAYAQLDCYVDLDGDGDVDSPGESATCDDLGLCPIDRTACALEQETREYTWEEEVVVGPPYICPRPGESANACTETGGHCLYEGVSGCPSWDPFCSCPAYDPFCIPEGEFEVLLELCVLDPDPATEIVEHTDEEIFYVDACPLGDAHACIDDGTGAKYCSAQACYDPTPGAGTVEEVERDREYVQADGATDSSGACLDEIRIFQGHPMDCRPVGAGTLFENCCNDGATDATLTDTSGAEGLVVGAAAVSTIFGGVSAAYGAYAAGATSSSAASVGTSFLSGAFDPTTLAVAVAFTVMVEMLDLGCREEDVETAMLRSSGFCHYIGDYCATNTPFGCLQKKRTHCCFNSLLGRIIHEQGRSQLASFASLDNGGWGTVENPHCDGFTPEEFQSLDFGSMDLSEYYDHLETAVAAEMQVDYDTALEDYTEENSI